MKKIPWKGIAIGSLVLVFLVVARSVVTVAKAFYYGQDWSAKLVEDPWFIVGIVAAVVGIGALIALAARNNKADDSAERSAEELPETPEET